jgi:hypothetical protein
VGITILSSFKYSICKSGIEIGLAGSWPLIFEVRLKREKRHGDAVYFRKTLPLPRSPLILIGPQRTWHGRANAQLNRSSAGSTGLKPFTSFVFYSVKQSQPL